MYRKAVVTGAIAGAVAVALGAFGAHGLKAVLEPNGVQVFETGVRYQFYHSIALVLVGLLHNWCPTKQVRMAATMFLWGILLFSGSLYVLTGAAIAGKSLGMFGIVTPIGGLLYIAGWLLLAAGVATYKDTERG